MTIYRFGPFRLEKEPLLLYVHERALPLGPKVVETLAALLEHPGEILGKTELMDRIWPDGFVEEANLAQNIYVIRKALRAHWNADAIETVPRRGYRFNGEVLLEEAPAHAPAIQPVTTLRRRPLKRAWALGATAAALLALLALPVAHAMTPAPQTLSAQGARFYAMGRYYWNQRTAPALLKSERYFESVTQSDPQDARGYAALAAAYAIEGDYGYGKLGSKVLFGRAAAYAQRALTYDRNCAEAYAVLGLVAIEEHHLMALGFEEYRHSLALDPSYAPAHQWYGSALLRSGRALEAYVELQRAANLDPESVAATDWLAQAAFVSRRYVDALAYGRQALDLSPQRYSVYGTVGMAYEALGNDRAAIAAYRTYAQLCKSCRYDAAALLARTYARMHQTALAIAQLNVARSGHMHDSAADIAAALLALGRKDEALATLRSSKDEPAALIAIDPRMDALRSDERFRRYTQSPG